ncbi:Rrf2 family transcriptional regulator [Metabacillus sp. Hm71]|uniref:Rrf2 family transcriptional regulator n=1 Tax=Metabacillus sp. Hm71 TaxID=3450743 RepID=UPI003F431E9D
MSYSLALWQGIEIVVYTAVKVEHGYYEFVSTRHLSESLGIPVPTAVKILQSLNRFGIMETREGAKGGIRLAKDAEDITLFDIFYAIEQDRPLFKMDVPSNLTSELATKIANATIQSLETAEQAMKDSLRNVTIAQLIRQ